MESSSRMRRCLRRNYRGSDHFGAAANYEDQVDMKSDQGNVPVLAAEAISMEDLREDDEHSENENFDGRVSNFEHGVKAQESVASAGQTFQSFVEPSDTLLGEHELQGVSAVAPGYVPSELDERIVFELPSSMVQPLRVIRGTFQVSFAAVNCI